MQPSLRAAPSSTPRLPALAGHPGRVGNAASHWPRPSGQVPAPRLRVGIEAEPGIGAGSWALSRVCAGQGPGGSLPTLEIPSIHEFIQDTSFGSSLGALSAGFNRG